MDSDAEDELRVVKSCKVPLIFAAMINVISIFFSNLVAQSAPPETVLVLLRLKHRNMDLVRQVAGRFERSLSLSDVPVEEAPQHDERSIGDHRKELPNVLDCMFWSRTRRIGGIAPVVQCDSLRSPMFFECH